MKHSFWGQNNRNMSTNFFLQLKLVVPYKKKHVSTIIDVKSNRLIEQRYNY